MPHPTSSANAEWRRFTTALAEALAELTPYTYLVVARPGIAHFVQFAGEPGGDLRAEAASNQYIETFGPLLTEQDYARMESLGWRRPTNLPPEMGPPIDPQGSPNFYRDFAAPVDLAAVARLAVAALRRVYRVGSLDDLEYNAFHRGGRPIAFPALGLAARRRPTIEEQLAEVERDMIDGTDDEDDNVGGFILPVSPYDAALSATMPPEIQAAVDGLLRDYDGRTRSAADAGFFPLVSWLNDHFGSLDVQMPGLHRRRPVNPSRETSGLSDAGLLKAAGGAIDPGATTDALRLAHIDCYVGEVLDGAREAEAGHEPAWGWVWIESSEGYRAAVGFGITEYPGGEVAIEWYSVYARHEGIETELKGRGWVLDRADLASRTAEEKLGWWHRN